MQFSNVSSFEDFEQFLHREFHDSVHCVIGGQMCTDDSASAPEFFLHHAFVDKLWSDWQRQSTEHTKNEFFISQTLKMPATNHLPKDFLNLREQPECTCVRYRDPGDEIYQTLMGTSSYLLIIINIHALYISTTAENKVIYSCDSPYQLSRPITYMRAWCSYCCVQDNQDVLYMLNG